MSFSRRQFSIFAGLSCFVSAPAVAGGCVEQSAEFVDERGQVAKAIFDAWFARDRAQMAKRFATDDVAGSVNVSRFPSALFDEQSVFGVPFHFGEAESVAEVESVEPFGLNLLVKVREEFTRAARQDGRWVPNKQLFHLSFTTADRSKASGLKLVDWQALGVANG